MSPLPVPDRDFLAFQIEHALETGEQCLLPTGEQCLLPPEHSAVAAGLGHSAEALRRADDGVVEVVFQGLVEFVGYRRACKVFSRIEERLNGVLGEFAVCAAEYGMLLQAVDDQAERSVLRSVPRETEKKKRAADAARQVDLHLADFHTKEDAELHFAKLARVGVKSIRRARRALSGQ